MAAKKAEMAYPKGAGVSAKKKEGDRSLLRKFAISERATYDCTGDGNTGDAKRIRARHCCCNVFFALRYDAPIVQAEA